MELTQRNPLPAWFEFSFGARLGCRDLERRELGAAQYRHYRRSLKEERTGVAGLRACLMGMGSYLSLGATAPLCGRSSMLYGSDAHLIVAFPEHLALPLRQT